MQEHPDRSLQPKINESILRIAQSRGYEYVATNNAYYITPDDAEVQDMMSAVAAGRDLDDPDRPTLMNGDYSLRPSREMEELFIYAPKAYENTQKIANMIDLQIDYGTYKIPVFPLSEEEQKRYNASIESIRGTEYIPLSKEEWVLRSLCIDGLNFRYGFGLDDSQKNILLHKIARENTEMKLSQMSVEDLHVLAESYYSDTKKALISEWDPSKKEIISRLEYELAVVDLM